MLKLDVLKKIHQKNAEFDIDLESVRKVINEKVIEKYRVLTIRTECKSFRPIILCVNFLALFFNGFKLSIAFCVTLRGFFRTNFFAFIKIFAKIKAKSGRNGSKKRKRILKMCPRIPFYICITASGS